MSLHKNDWFDQIPCLHSSMCRSGMFWSCYLPVVLCPPYEIFFLFVLKAWLCYLIIYFFISIMAAHACKYMVIMPLVPEMDFKRVWSDAFWGFWPLSCLKIITIKNRVNLPTIMAYHLNLNQCDHRVTQKKLIIDWCRSFGHSGF